MTPDRVTNSPELSSLFTSPLPYDYSGETVIKAAPTRNERQQNRSLEQGRGESPAAFITKTFGKNLAAGSDYILSKLSDIGGWWKRTKQAAGTQLDLALGATSIATSPDDVYSDYQRGVGKIIARADGVSLEEGIARAPKAMQYQTTFSKTVGVAGKLLNGATGALDTLEALHDEGGQPGKKTMKTITKTVAQTAATAVASAALFTIAGGAAAISVAPIAIGIAGGAAIGYGIGKGFDYIFG